ncbi:MAG: NAD(P)-dependent alcohol dehydrogenase [Syntrophomonadaceae bacterium]
MKAVVYEKYGSPDVLKIKEVAKPVPKDNEVLIKVHAATVNRTDCGFRDPEYIIVRLVGGLFRPGKKILGNELSGVIEKTGKDVKSFKEGDRVFGLTTTNFGTHAEYVCVPEKGSIAEMPSNMSYEEAAAVCDGLMLAINYIRKINFKTANKILINGASGSIGSACLQLAKYYGAGVTAVCSTNSLELMKSLGADEVIDYTKEDFTKCGRFYDIVIDAVGKSSFFRCRRLLKPGGIYFSTDLGFLWQNIYLSLFTGLAGGRKVMFPIPKDSKEDILFFKNLIEDGKYKAVIDRCYPLDKIIEATEYVETGQKTGNVVITINN